MVLKRYNTFWQSASFLLDVLSGGYRMNGNKGRKKVPEDDGVSLAYENDLIVKLRFGTLVFRIILDNNFFSPYEVEYIERHNHAIYEIHYVLSGTSNIVVDNKELQIHPDTYYIIAPNVYHEQRINTKDHVHKYMFFIDYQIFKTENSIYPEEEEERNILDAFKSIRFFSQKGIKDHLFLLNEIRKELQNLQVGYYSRVQSIFKLLLIQIVRDILSGKKADYRVPFGSVDEKKTLIIEKFFDTGYHRDITAEQLANQLHVSIRQLNRIMRDKYNMTFMQKLIEIRMEAAKKYLESTDLSVNEISKKVGYDSESNFYHTFKKMNNCTPGEYRLWSCKK
jgi:AraC-like DNA-binding protein